MGLSIFERRSRLSRIVFHIDVNSAFLSWSALERLEQNPDSVDLRTIPSAVAGDVASRHGVVTAASIPAKRCGVHSGQPVSCARSACPGLVLVSANAPGQRATRRSSQQRQTLRNATEPQSLSSISEKLSFPSMKPPDLFSLRSSGTSLPVKQKTPPGPNLTDTGSAYPI